MTGINDSFVEKLKSTIDIVNVVSDYVSLKKAGSNYKGLCPFHQENTPSFTVNQERQFYYCFGCGSGGDVINFVMELENLTFRETLKILAQRVGMTLPSLNSDYQIKQRKEKERVFQLNKLSAKLYHYLLMKTEKGKVALEYMNNRGFTKKDMQFYYLGYAPDEWHFLLDFMKKRGFDEKELIKAGLVSEGKNNSCYDKFRGRLIFPIFNIRNEVIAFGGRILDDNKSVPKYLNSPDTPVYKKGENLYGLNWAKEEMRKTGAAVIMEGYTDILTAHKNGISNAIASLGTAFTSDQARLLKRYSLTIYISYDADAAGGRATLKGLDILSKEDLNVRVITLPENQDPDEFIKDKGKTGFLKLQESAVNLIEFKIGQVIKKYNLKKIDEKIGFIKEIIKILANIKDDINRDIHIENVCQKYNLKQDTIKKGIKNYLQAEYSKNKDKNYKSSYTKKDNERNNRININDIEMNLLKLYFHYPEKRNFIRKFMNPDFFTKNNKELIKLLNKYPELDNDKLLNKIDNDAMRNIILSLLVSDTELAENIDNIIYSFIKYVKSDIYSKLQNNNNYNLQTLNSILLEFIYLSI
ncbi:MAG: DNA primase [Halanaerobiaceae bacterium]